MNTLDKLVARIKRLVADMAASSDTYNKERNEQKSILRTSLATVREGYKHGKTFNGQATWTDWCRWANPRKGTKDPTRWFQMVLGENPKSLRVTTLKPGMVVKQHGSDSKYTVTVVSVKKDADDEASFEIEVKPYVEEPALFLRSLARAETSRESVTDPQGQRRGHLLHLS